MSRLKNSDWYISAYNGDARPPLAVLAHIGARYPDLVIAMQPDNSFIITNGGVNIADSTPIMIGKNTPPNTVKELIRTSLTEALTNYARYTETTTNNFCVSKGEESETVLGFLATCVNYALS